MRVSSDKQTLILAGEANPPPLADAGRTYTSRSGVGSQLQRVTVLVVQGEYAATGLAADSSSVKFSATADSESDLDLLPSVAAIDAPALPAQFLVPYPSSNRALSAGAAEYARTQDLSGGRTRNRLIDTYA